MEHTQLQIEWTVIADLIGHVDDDIGSAGERGGRKGVVESKVGSKGFGDQKENTVRLTYVGDGGDVTA